MSNPKWRTLLAASVIFANPATLQAAPPSDHTPAYRPISFAEFQRMVWAGREIRGRLVPAKYIVYVLEHADENLLERSPNARLRLTSSKVTGGTIQPEKPTREIEDKPAVYFALPIEISDTDFDAKLYLDRVVVEKPITLDNVDFRQSVSFQGAAFREQVGLTRTRFRGVTNFSYVFLEETGLSFIDCEFDFQANFANLTIRSGSALYIGGDHVAVPLDFSGSQISGTLTLEGLERTLRVDGAVYLNGVNNKSGVPVGTLSVKDILIHDNVYMDRSRWAQLDLAGSEGGRHRPIRFLGFYDLREGLFDTVDLSGAEFDGGGDFSGSEFRTTISFERTTLRQPVRMTWGQLGGKLPVPPPANTSQGRAKRELILASYQELERNFEKLDDVASLNKCHYDRRWKLEGINIPWLISGYWVVWWRPLPWVLGSLLAFYCINRWKYRQWFGLKKSAAGGSFIPEPWALTIQATFRFVLPKEYWGTANGQRLYLLESLWLKIILGVFIFTLKNTSPLLKELLPYLLPK